MIGKFFVLIRELLNKAIIFIKYNDDTIAEYYRKQGAHVGRNCRIEIRVRLHQAHLVEIGDHVFIGAGALLHTYDLGSWIAREEIPDLTITGKIIIEDNCMIGANSQLLPNIRIGQNSIVGAGSVVISDVPPNSIVMGVPARVIGSSLKYRERHVAEWKERMVSKDGGKQA
jgi:maltose O-acetyltransferase